LPLYTSRGIVYTLKVHREAQSDLNSIGTKHPDVRDEIVALLQEIGGSQDLLDALTIKDFGINGDKPIHVDWWWELQQQGLNAWRFKAWDLEEAGLHFRVIYVLDSPRSRYIVLAVLPRSFDYDVNHPRIQQLLATCERLGIDTRH
jgi:mRNA-degrading endonuclease RelE of RelBE toxin-antitoxin system